MLEQHEAKGIYFSLVFNLHVVFFFYYFIFSSKVSTSSSSSSWPKKKNIEIIAKLKQKIKKQFPLFNWIFYCFQIFFTNGWNLFIYKFVNEILHLIMKWISHWKWQNFLCIYLAPLSTINSGVLLYFTLYIFIEWSGYFMFVEFI